MSCFLWQLTHLPEPPARQVTALHTLMLLGCHASVMQAFLTDFNTTGLPSCHIHTASCAMMSCLCVAACVQNRYTCVPLLVDKPEGKACASLGQNVDCSVESAGRPNGGILINGAINMLLMHCSKPFLHCAGQTCHKATSI